MNVKQLKEWLIGIPDEAILMVRGSDHSYHPCCVDSTKAVKTIEAGYGANYCEDFYPDEKPEEGKSRVPILLFSL